MSRRNNESGAEPRKRVLIPFWILQIFGAGVSTIGSILELIPSTGVGSDNATTEAQYVIYPPTQKPNDCHNLHINNITANQICRFQAMAVYYAFFSTLTLLLTVLEPFLYCCHKLHPLTFLCLEIAKTTIMLALLGRRIVENALQGSNPSVAIAIIILAVFLYVLLLLRESLQIEHMLTRLRCFFLTTLIYSAVLYHRHRRYKKYNPVGSTNHSVSEPNSGSNSEPLSGSREYLNSGKQETGSQAVYEMGIPPNPVYETEAHMVHEMFALDNAHKLKPKLQELPVEMP